MSVNEIYLLIGDYIHSISTVPEIELTWGVNNLVTAISIKIIILKTSLPVCFIKPLVPLWTSWIISGPGVHLINPGIVYAQLGVLLIKVVILLY